MTVPLHHTDDARPGRSTWVRAAELALLAAFATAFGVAAALAIQLCSTRGILLDDPAQRALFEPLLILAATLPAAPLAAACTGRHPASLVSTTRRIRWPVAGRALALTIGVYAAATAGVALWARVSGEPAPVSETCSVALVCALCAVITLQSAAEELVFRAALPRSLARAHSDAGAHTLLSPTACPRSRSSRCTRAVQARFSTSPCSPPARRG